MKYSINLKLLKKLNMNERFIINCRRCGKHLESNREMEFQNGSVYCETCFDGLEYNWKKRDLLESKKDKVKEQRTL